VTSVPTITATYVLARYPCRSETFIAREIEGLVALGMRLDVIVLDGDDPETDLTGDGDPLMDYGVWQCPRWYTPRAWGAFLQAAICRPLRTVNVFRFALDTAKRERRGLLRGLRLGWFAALASARVSKHGARVIHAHFANDPATVALAISQQLNLPCGFSAHARDVYAEKPDYRGKAAMANYVLCCSAAAAAEVRSLVAPVDGDKIRTVYHGLDLDRWRPTRLDSVSRDPTVVAVGRFVLKKGLSVLVQACAILRQRGVRLVCHLVGAGVEAERLKDLVAELDLGEMVKLVGWMTEDELRTELEAAWVVVVPSVIAADHDRDNIPNVLVEAMAMEAPVVASDLPGIAEVLVSSEAGLLVPPEDPAALADAIAGVLEDGPRRNPVARQLIAERFEHEACARRLADVLIAVAVSP